MNPKPSKHKKLKRVIITLVIFIIIYSLISTVVSMCVFSTMFARFDKDSNPLFFSYADIDSNKYPREPKTFKSGENKLKGYLYTTAKDSKGTVIVVNGYHCTADRHLSEIMYFVDKNWSVFAYDGTGVGKSGGDSQVGFTQFRNDASAAVKYVSTLSSKPVVLYGHSAGGYAATTTLEDNSNIKAVVSVSGFNSPLELMHLHTKNNAGLWADIGYPFMYAQNYVTFGNDANTQAYEAINSTDIPVAVFQGKSDSIVPYEISIYSHKNKIKNPNVNFVEVASNRGNHSTVWLSDSAAEYTLKYQKKPFDNPDKKQANELDKEFMESVLEFYNKAIK